MTPIITVVSVWKNFEFGSTLLIQHLTVKIIHKSSGPFWTWGKEKNLLVACLNFGEKIESQSLCIFNWAVQFLANFKLKRRVKVRINFWRHEFKSG